MGRKKLKATTLKAPKKLNSISESTKKFMEKYSYTYKAALKKGEKYREVETKKFGGSRLPFEAGGEKYFEKV